jgi:hypothetical protein
MDRTAKAEARAKRRPFIETLEDRRLMAIDLDDPRLSFPAIGNYTAYLPPGISYSDYASRSNQSTRGTGGGGSPSGESGGTISVTESEPNNIQSQANFLNLGTAAGKAQNVNVLATLPSSGGVGGIPGTTSDVDYFSFDLRAGDILSVELVTNSIVDLDVAVFDASQSEQIGTRREGPGGNSVFLPPSSPLANSTAAIWFGATIPSDGRYFLRVADGLGSYNLRLKALRNSIEAEPIGTKQIVFLDFDGAILDGNIFGTGRTSRIPSMIDTLSQYGFQPNEESQLISLITDRFTRSFTGVLPTAGGNGYYSADGRPGAFDIEVRNSRDHADPWGLPNVSRIIFGGGIFDLGIPTVGIAQYIDVGNFEREDTGIVLLEPFFDFGIEDVPRAPSKSLSEVFALAAANVGVHEMGHLLGAFHQDNANRNVTMMDSGSLPFENSLIRVGPDGIYGTDDDGDLRFGRDRYQPLESYTGTVDHARTAAFALSTGTRGGSVTGLVYNDANRNARQDGTEGTLSGWQVFVDLDNNGIRGSAEPTTTTDASGRYNLALGAGTYNLRVVYPAGWVASTSSEAFKTVTVTMGGTASANFGAAFPTVGATGFKWLDLNGDGIRDANEPGLAGVYIYLDLDGDGRPDIGEPAAISQADGSYTLTPPRAGAFQIREVVDPGYVQTFPTSGFHNAVFDGNTPLKGFDFGNRESSDWGDAPTPYPTTRAQNGASHGILTGLRLGPAWDAELDGVNSINADADDTTGVDDEDGITLLTPLVRGDSQNSIRINVVNTIGTAAYVQGWIDFNGNGSWNDAGEQIVTNLLVTPGDNIVNFTVPANATSRTAARFRLSQTPGLAPTGRATTGEVEDYMFSIVDGPRRNLQDDLFSVTRNSTANQLDVLANDFVPPNDSISAVLLSQPTQGGAVNLGSGNIVRYTPARGFFGQESFTYTVVYGSGKRETATVTVNVVLQFIDPVAVDDSYDIPTDSTSFPLNVLLNDIEGQNGALTVTSISTPNQGGSATIGSGGLSIRYTPRRGFGGTERFTYTAVDGAGKSTTANVTVHTLGGDRLDDDVQFNFAFYSMSGQPITQVTQGDQFQVYVYTYDLRPDRGLSQSPPVTIVDPGVYAAYLDVLYSSTLVQPASPSTNTTLDFANVPQGLYQSGVSGTAQIPGVISSLGAFTGSSKPPFSFDNPSLFQILTFNTRSAGIAEFVGDPANQSPNTDVVLYNPSPAPPNTPVAIEKIRYLRSSIEVLPRGVELPFAVDDSPAPLALNTTSFIDVLSNDIIGTAGPIRISGVTQPRNGSVIIDTRGTSTPTDDRIQFVPISTTVGYTDQFTYTITDTRGFSSIGTVTVQVGDTSANDQVRLTLRTTDINGNPISTIPVGSEFELRGYVQDLRSPFNQSGVFAAYQDILYDRNLVAVKTSTGGLGFEISFAQGSSGYDQGKSGDILIPGLINEVGSFQNSLNPLGTEELMQFKITMRANTAGVARFAGDPADISPFHDTLLFSDQRNKVAIDRISYIPATIVIGGSGSGGGSGEGYTNLNNRFDVNNDGFVSPIDVLILVNLMNQGQGGALGGGGSGGNAEGEDGDSYYVDVDGDGYLTPLDALGVVNELNGRVGSGGEGEGAPVIELASAKSTPKMTPVTSNLANSLASLVGPQVASAATRSSSAMSLDSYLASLANIDEEEEEGVDAFLGDLLKVRFGS